MATEYVTLTHKLRQLSVVRSKAYRELPGYNTSETGNVWKVN